MADQSNQTSQDTLNVQELRQSLLDQISAEQKALEELSDEELEAVAGGVRVSLPVIPAWADHVIGAAEATKKWISKPSNQVAVGGPAVTAVAAFSVGFVDKATGNKS